MARVFSAPLPRPPRTCSVRWYTAGAARGRPGAQRRPRSPSSSGRQRRAGPPPPTAPSAIAPWRLQWHPPPRSASRTCDGRGGGGAGRTNLTSLSPSPRVQPLLCWAHTSGRCAPLQARLLASPPSAHRPCMSTSWYSAASWPRSRPFHAHRPTPCGHESAVCSLWGEHEEGRRAGGRGAGHLPSCLPRGSPAAGAASSPRRRRRSGRQRRASGRQCSPTRPSSRRGSSR